MNTPSFSDASRPAARNLFQALLQSLKRRWNIYLMFGLAVLTCFFGAMGYRSTCEFFLMMTAISTLVTENKKPAQALSSSEE